MVKKRSFFTGVSGFRGFGVSGGLRPTCLTRRIDLKSRKGQMKIMQMSFMILGLFLFFILVGLFFLSITLSDIRSGAEELAREEAIASIGTIASMSELSYDSDDVMKVDEDKLRILAGGAGKDYEDFWPVASIEVYKVYPGSSEVVKCPASDCNYYEIYDSGQRNVDKISSYVSICKRVKESGFGYEKCEIGKLVVGMVIWEDEE